jgi:hypothetical protein
MARIPACSTDEVATADIPFEHVTIDGHAPVNQWATGVGDINGDGYVDVVTSGNTPGKGGLYWYEYPTWAKHVIDATGGFSDDLQLVDVDGDGDLDIVVPEDGSKEIRWYENPGPKGNPVTDPWKVHVIGSYANYHFESAHDLQVADLNGDGKVDVVIGNQKWKPPRPVDQPEDVVFFQINPDSWTPVVVSNTYGEGTCLTDLNGDGRPDIVKGGWWLENPKDPIHDKWPEHWIALDWQDRAGVAVADINQDGRPDLVLAAAEAEGRLSWFEAPPDSIRGTWKEHVINEHVDYVHGIQVADVNNDGKPDVVFAEMQPQSAHKRVGFFLNEGRGANWRLQVVATTGSHNIRVPDVDRDGDVDIIGANWNTETDPNHAPMEMWRNLLSDRHQAHHLPLDKWTYIEIDSQRGKWGDFDKPEWLRYFGLAIGDVNGDGDQDIVAGRYYYRNPGGNITAPWKRITFPINVDGMLLTDVDGDGQLDVIGEAIPDVYWLKPLDRQGDSWKATKIGTLPEGTDYNGQGYMVAQLVPGSKRPQIILSSAHGIFYFMIPDYPEKGNWPRVEITPEGYDEGIGVGDVNGDGFLDISARYGKDGKSLAWWQNPGDGSGHWVKHPVGETTIEMDRDVMADINGDGRPDIVVTEEKAWSGDSVFWFEQAGPRENPSWLRHTLVTQFTTNSLDVADMNNDGSLDIVAAEHRGTKKLEIWENLGHGSSWVEHIISTGRENHIGARVADLDGDGDLDIVGTAWDGYQHLHLWRNNAILRLGGALTVATPMIAPAGGSGTAMWVVHITTETQHAIIRYTLDGNEPTTSSALYVEPLIIAGSVLLKARAFTSGMNDSEVAGATFATTYHY